MLIQISSDSISLVLTNRLYKFWNSTLFSYLDKFGFGNKTGIDLNGESSGILFKYDNIGPVEQATMSFGQGISVTPIHLTV